MSSSKQALHNIHTDTQGFRFSILDQCPETMKFLHVSSFSKNVLAFPGHCTTSKCGISLDHPEDKGAGKRPDCVIFSDDHGASALLASGLIAGEWMTRCYVIQMFYSPGNFRPDLFSKQKLSYSQTWLLAKLIKVSFLKSKSHEKCLKSHWLFCSWDTGIKEQSGLTFSSNLLHGFVPAWCKLHRQAICSWPTDRLF